MNRVMCQLCRKMYKNLNCLRTHLAQDCGQRKKFACPLDNCNKQFKRKYDLKVHMIYVHRPNYKVEDATFRVLAD